MSPLTPPDAPTYGYQTDQGQQDWLDMYRHVQIHRDIAPAPVGTIWMWYGSSAAVPFGWAICDGTNGTPDLRGRVPVGIDSGQTEFDTLGETGGAKTHTLTSTEMPSHNHTQNSHNHTQNAHGHTTAAHDHGGATGNNNGNTGSTEPPNHTHDETGSHINDTLQGGWSGGTQRNAFSGPFHGRTQATLGVKNSIAHTHTLNNHGHGIVESSPAAENTTATNIAATATNQATGGGAAHNNLQPYLALHFIMRIAI